MAGTWVSIGWVTKVGLASRARPRDWIHQERPCWGGSPALLSSPISWHRPLANLQRMSPESPGVSAEQFSLWLRVRLKVRIQGESLVLYDPTLGYGDYSRLLWQGFTETRSRQLYVLTAWNPSATARDSYSNRVAQAELLLYLFDAGMQCFPSCGSGPDWFEPGTAFFSEDPGLARAVALRFGQFGYYRFGESGGYCVDATGKFQDSPLGGSPRENQSGARLQR